MEFIEQPIFTDIVSRLLADKEYRVFQNTLMEAPNLGDLISGTGGARKIRVRVGNNGNSGGARAIYYFQTKKCQIWFLALYAKSDKDNIDQEEKNLIKLIVSQIKKVEL